MNFWDEVDAREQARKKAAIEYRESIRRQKEAEKLMMMKNDDHLKQTAKSIVPSQAWMNESQTTTAISKPYLPPISNNHVQQQYTKLHLISYCRSLQKTVSTNVNESNASISLLQQELLAEKERTSKLEAELRNQSAMIQSIHSHLEQQKFAIAEASNTKFLSQKYERQLSMLTEQQNVSKLRSDEVEAHLKQLMQEVNTRQSFLDQERKDFSEKSKLIIDELQALKYKYEQFTLESVQADKELFLRTRELESSAAQDTTIKQTVRNHDIKLVSFERDLYQIKENLDTKFSKLFQDFRSNGDLIEKKQIQMEANFQKQYTDLKNIVELFTRDASTKFLSVREKVMSSVESDMGAMNNQIRDAMSQLKRLEMLFQTRVSTNEGQIEEKLGLLHQAMKDEVSTRKQSEKSVRNEVDMVVKSIHLELQNIRENYDEAVIRAKSEIVSQVKKTLENQEKSGEDIVERLRAVEDKLLSDNKKAYEQSQTLRNWVDDSLAKAQQDFQTALDSKFAVNEHAYQSNLKRIETSFKNDLETIVSNLRDKEIKTIGKDFENARVNMMSFERSLTQRVDEIYAKLLEVQVRFDGWEEKHAEKSSNPHDSTQMNKIAVEKLESKLETMVTLINEISQKLELNLKDVYKLRKDVDQKASVQQMKEELSHLELTLKSLDNGVKKTWKVIDSMSSPQPLNGSSGFIADILNDLHQQNERVTAIQRSVDTIEKRVDDTMENISEEISPKIYSLETEFHMMKHELNDDVIVKLEDMKKDFCSFQASVTKAIAQQKDQHSSEFEKYGKNISKSLHDLHEQIKSVQKQFYQLESQTRKSQDRYNHAQITALEDQLEKFSKWKEGIHREIAEIKAKNLQIKSDNNYSALFSNTSTINEHEEDDDDDEDFYLQSDNQSILRETESRHQDNSSRIEFSRRENNSSTAEEDSEQMITKVLEEADRIFAEGENLHKDFQDIQYDQELEDPQETRKSILKSLNDSLNRAKAAFPKETEPENPGVVRGKLNEKFSHSLEELRVDQTVSSANRRIFSETNLTADQQIPVFQRPVKSEASKPKVSGSISRIPKPSSTRDAFNVAKPNSARNMQKGISVKDISKPESITDIPKPSSIRDIPRETSTRDVKNEMNTRTIAMESKKDLRTSQQQLKSTKNLKQDLEPIFSGPSENTKDETSTN